MPTTTATELAQLGGLVTTDSSTSTVTVNGTLAATTITLPNNSVSTASISNSSVTAAKLANPQYTGFRNRIINGDMRIDQRNAGAAVTASGSFPVDRFGFGYSFDGAVSVQQSSVAPSNFTNSLAITVTGQDSSIGASQYFQLFQKVEGYNVADFDFGKSSARNVILSFWVRSSKTGIYYCSIGNDSINRMIPLQYSITSANTWEQKTITISGDTTGTWKTDNGTGMYVLWNLALGSNFNAGTNNVWGTSQWGATNQVNLFDTNGATFYITGVQLEAGSTATDFERRPYGTELALCQRYYEVGNAWLQVTGTAPSAGMSQQYSVTKRAAATNSFTNITYYNGSALTDYSSTISAPVGTTALSFYFIPNATGSAVMFTWSAASEL